MATALARYETDDKGVALLVRNRMRGDAIRLGLNPQDAMEYDSGARTVYIYDSRLVGCLENHCAKPGQSQKRGKVLFL